MSLLAVAAIGVVVSLVLSAILGAVILQPIRSTLSSLCATAEAVTFWTRFTILMLVLGPLIVTLVFGVPTGELAERLSDVDLVIRVLTASLVGSFLTLAGIGIRMGTLRYRTSPASQAQTFRRVNED
jgi:hypothetical protein